MFTPSELEGMSIQLEQYFYELENRVMSDIVRRIKINSEITRSADWQIYRLQQLGESKRIIKKKIKDSLNLSNKEVNHLFKDVIRQGYARDEQIYRTKGSTIIPFSENQPLKQLISAISIQTSKELKNITQSLGFAQKINGKIEFKPIADYYQKTLDAAMLDITSGAFDYNTVLKCVVKEMTGSGLRSVDYATGHSNRVPVAARRAIMTGFAQITGRINEENALQLGTNSFEVSYHSGARPTHQVWQGRVYTKEQLVSLCGLGSVTGLKGANCYHEYSPFIQGVSERIYTDKQLDEMNAKENTPIPYKGKEYTAYEATQRQRKLETTMRAERSQIKLLQEGGANENDLINARFKYRATSHEYVSFSKAMGLPQQRERVMVDGLGGIGRGQWKVDKVNKSGIIKAEIEKRNIKLEINSEKQNRHIKDTDEYVKGKSYLTISTDEIQNIVNKYSGKGELQFTKKGEWNKKEIVMSDKNIGYNIDPKTKIETITNRAKIHYSKTGTHLVPMRREKDERS